ncbi:MAG: TPM domain-containing protein [Bacteroidetes bacterium]|nr:TPM domain-containing protein [Bacteroidota bacterium]
MKLSKIIFLAGLFLLNFNSFAQNIPDKPNPPRLVNDFAEILTVREKQALENKLVTFSNETSTQIAIVTVKSLNGYDKASFSFQLGEKWGVGQKGSDNGIIILVKPKTRQERGQVFVAPGYGLEGVVPDATAKKIVEHDMLPLFKRSEYYSGLDAATNTLISLTKGEFTATQYNKATRKKSSHLPILFILIAIFFTIFGRSGRHRSMGHNLPFWMLLGMMGGSSNSGSFGDFSSGGGSFGGGFGGGSFGGGGAGGSW